MRIAVRNRGARGGDAPRPPDAVVPQRLGVAARWRQAEPDRRARRGARPRLTSRPRRLRRSRSGRRPDGSRPDAPVLRERDQPPADLRRPGDHALPEGRDQRPRRGRRADRQPGRHRDEGRGVVPGHGRGRRIGGAAAAAAPDRRRRRGESRPPAPTIRSGAGSRRRCASARPRPTSSTPTCAAPETTDEEALIMRQAFAGMLWSKQYYGYNVARWLDGDPGLPPPPHGAPAPGATPAGGTSTPPTSCRCPIRGSTRGSRHGTSRSTPSPWPTSTRPSRSTSCSCSAASGSSIPNGALPAYEWSFDDVNPPVHAAAALPRLGHRRPPGHRRSSSGSSTSCCSTSPGGSTARTPRATTCSRAASSGSTTSARSTARTSRPARSSSSPTRPRGCSLYCLSMLRIATVLAETDPAYDDLMTTFLEHAVRIGAAMNRSGLWDDDGRLLLRRAQARRRLDASRSRSIRWSG